METKAKSTEVYEIRLWKPTHWGESVKNKGKIRIYHGQITDAKTKEGKHFNSPGELLIAMEEMFIKAERSKPQKDE